MTCLYFGGYFRKPSVGDSCLVTGLVFITFYYFGWLLWDFGKPSVGDRGLVTKLLLMTFHYFGVLLCEAFRRGQLLSNRATFDDFSLLRGLLWEAFRRGQLLSNRVTFDYFSLLRRVTLGSLPSGTAA